MLRPRIPVKFRSILPGILLASASLVAVAGVAEIGLRVWGYSRPRILSPSIRSSYRIEPNARFTYRGFLPGTFEDFENVVELNRLGFHDRFRPPERPTPDTYRLMVLGDSYVAAFEVGIEETFHKRLERRLRARDPLQRDGYQVLAFGRGNRAQEAQLEWLRRYGPEYRPDAVLLLFFCGNDIMENSPETFRAASDFVDLYLEKVVPRKVGLFKNLMLVPGSRLNGFVAETLTDWYARNLHRFHDDLDAHDLQSTELGLYRTPLEPEWRRAWERTERLLDDIRQEADARDSRFAVASLAGPQAVGDVGLATLWRASGEGYDFERPLRWIDAWGSSRDVPVVQLGPALAEAGRSEVFWRHDAHLTPTGHAVVADLLYDFLFGPGGVLRTSSRATSRASTTPGPSP